VSLILAACALAALAASAGGGYWVAGRRRSNEEGAPPKKDAPGPSPAAQKRRAASEFAGLPLALGDVVVADREERWLAGGLLAKEGDRVVAAIYFAPEGARLKTVVAFAAPRRDVLWLDAARVDSPSEPPAALEIEGVPMTRRGRLPVALSRHGQGVPNVGSSGILAEYEGGADEIAVLLTSEGRAYVWRGRRLGEGQYDRLGSGGDG
jgi:hypothetical protein